MSSQVVLALMIIKPILLEHGQELVVTSVSDGKHSRNSKHYIGQAFDIRTWNLDDREEATREIQDALGDEFYVKLETDHIHIQFNGSTTS